MAQRRRSSAIIPIGRSLIRHVEDLPPISPPQDITVMTKLVIQLLRRLSPSRVFMLGRPNSRENLQGQACRWLVTWAA